MPAARNRRPRSLIAFGTAIGLLSALSTATGTTATLIGLLFTLIGGTLLSWFDTAKIPPQNRVLVMRYAGVISVGILLGLLGGMALRFLDQYFLQPAIVARHASVSRSLLSGSTDTRITNTPDAAQQRPELGRQMDELMAALRSGSMSVVHLHAVNNADLEKLAADIGREAAAVGTPTASRQTLAELQKVLLAFAVARKQLAEVRDRREAYSALLSDETKASFNRFLAAAFPEGEQE